MSVCFNINRFKFIIGPLASISVVYKTYHVYLPFFLLLQEKVKSFGIDEKNMFTFWDVSVKI